MEAIIWKLCTSKALGSRQRTVMLWQGRERLASNVHFLPSFLQENPVLSVLSWQLWVLAPQSQPTPSRHAWVQAGKVRVWGQGFWWRKATDTQIAQGWEEAGCGHRQIAQSPRGCGFPLPVWLAQQSQSFMPLAAWVQGMTDAWGHPVQWQNPSLFCLHRRRLNITPVPDFLYQKCTSSPAPLRVLRVFGLVKVHEILSFAIVCCGGIEQDFWRLKNTQKEYFGLLMRKGAEWPKQVAQNCLALERTEVFG